MERHLYISSVSEKQQEEYDDELHKIINAKRGDDMQDLISSMMGLSDNHVKTLLLALVYKRYHRLAPEAKATDEEFSGGEGERLIFYKAFGILFEGLFEQDESKMIGQSHTRLQSALKTLLKLAPLAGGSRDVSQLIQDMVQFILKHNTSFSDFKKAKVTESLSGTVAKAVCVVETGMKEHNPAACLLESLLQVAAETLDNDFGIVRASKQDPDGDRGEQLPSTLHVFIPHHGRGRSRKKKGSTGDNKPDFSERQLINCVSELLLFRRTTAASSVPGFSTSYEQLVSLGAADAALSENQDQIKKARMSLEAVIRRLRKEINDYGRANGFMLTDQFSHDASKLHSRHINGGKAGDLSNVARLAGKKSDSRILSLIQLRGLAHPSKVTPYGSVREILKDLAAARSDDEANADAEVADIQRSIFVSRIKQTVALLRKKVSAHGRSTVVASLESSELNHIAAALVTAALSIFNLESDEASAHPEPMETEDKPQRDVKLLIAGVHQNLNSLGDLLSLLDSIAGGLQKNAVDAPTYMDAEGTATTKAVMNLLDRHVSDGETLILVTAADILLPGTVMKDLMDRGCSVHCHDASDDLADRLRRENAKTGDVTISLAWDTVDDLDLHVEIPGGEKISFQNTHSKDGLCKLDVDMNACGDSKEPVENVFCGCLDSNVQAPKGRYKVVVQNFAYHSGETGAIPFRVVIDRNGTKERLEGECRGTGVSSNVTVCEFDYEGRTIPFPSEEKAMTAFGTSNLVNLTSSTGQTLESIGQLVQVTHQNERLDTLRTLVNDEDPGTQEERPTVAATGTLEVTSRDRSNIKLFGLPRTFHNIVNEEFGGPSLAELCAEGIAKQLVADRIPISAVKSAGYPSDVVDAVKAKMAVMDPMVV